MQIVPVERGRIRARTKGGAAVALVHAGVVSIPVKLHALALALVPDRRKIRGANLFGVGGQVHAEIQQGFGRAEGVDSARAELRLLHNERETVVARDQRVLHGINGVETQKHAVEQVFVDSLALDLADKEPRVELFALRGDAKKFVKTAQVHGI